MPLTKADRIAFSKKIVEAPLLINAINQSKSAIQVEKAKLIDLDNGHKNLVDSRTTLIDAYQLELKNLDGITRSNLTEADQQNAADFVLGNSLYPNNPNNPPPSTSPSIWTKTKPYARNKAVGKFYNESYGATVTKESDLISLVQSKISSIQSAYVLIESVTGQKCISGTCSLPQYTTQPTCTGGGGIWNPANVITTYTEVHTDLSDLITKVNNLKNFLIAEASTVYLLDFNSTRKVESLAALNNIQNVIIPAINAWLSVTSFNTSHGQTTCVGFYGYNPALLAPTKLSTATINGLLSALSARTTFIGTRKTQLEGYLGSITQNLSTAETTGTGLYFERWSFVQLRLNMLGGSLVALKGYERAEVAQNEQIANITQSKQTYELILKCSAFASAASGTKFITVKDASGFSVGDNVFVIADEQEELIRTIEEIDGNRLKLGQIVPANYRDVSFGRVYKDLS